MERMIFPRSAPIGRSKSKLAAPTAPDQGRAAVIVATTRSMSVSVIADSGWQTEPIGKKFFGNGPAPHPSIRENRLLVYRLA